MKSSTGEATLVTEVNVGSELQPSCRDNDQKIMTNTGVCMQQVKLVCSSFLQNRANVIKTLFNLLKFFMKVEFKLTTLPLD